MPRLAERLGVNPLIKTISPKFPWTILPPQLWLAPLKCFRSDEDRLHPPWPNLLIASGRQTVALSMAIKSASRGQTMTIQIQNPGLSVSKFDLVIAPKHDLLVGENVIETNGALHSITEKKLIDAANQLEICSMTFRDH